MAKKTVENFVARAIRLYEQEPGETEASAPPTRRFLPMYKSQGPIP